MKKICIFVFSLACIFSGCQSVPPSPEAVSIDAVYVYNMGVLANSNSPSAIVAKLRSVSLIGCPADFVNAYNNYVEAWSGVAKLEKKMYSENLKKADSSFEDFINTYQNNSSEAVVTLKKDWKPLSSEIDSATSSLAKSFTEMKIVGARYNVVYKSSAWF